MNLVTLTQIKRYCGIADDFTADDALLTRLLIDGEQWATKTMHKNAKPIIETRTFDYTDPSIIYFDDDLLELITVTNGDSTNVTLTDLYTTPRRMYPKFGIGFELGASTSFVFDATPENAISIKAAWGYHDDWGNAWVDSLDKVIDAAGINASVTAITVGDVLGANVDNDTPRFSAGMLIKIDSEWCEVTAANNGATDTLTVKRGSLGSTAAAHALNAKIYTFSPARNVVGAIMAYCHWRYNQKNNRADYGSEIPKDITDLLPYPVRSA